MCEHEARLTNVGIFNKTKSVVFELAAFQCTLLTQNQCFP